MFTANQREYIKQKHFAHFTNLRINLMSIFICREQHTRASKISRAIRKGISRQAKHLLCVRVEEGDFFLLLFTVRYVFYSKLPSTAPGETSVCLHKYLSKPLDLQSGRQNIRITREVKGRGIELSNYFIDALCSVQVFVNFPALNVMEIVMSLKWLLIPFTVSHFSPCTQDLNDPCARKTKRRDGCRKSCVAKQKIALITLMDEEIPK